MESHDWLEDYLNDEETIKLYSKWNEAINLNTGYFFGKRNGTKRNQIATAKKLIARDMSIDDICDITKLNKEEILTLIAD